jgi:hypothetical protein
MSAEAAVTAEDLDQDFAPAATPQPTQCDDFFSWIEVEHRKNSMSVTEAAALLSIDHAEAVEMIHDGSLCATFDETTEDWLVKTACVRAQLAESISIGTENGPRRTHHVDRADEDQDETVDNQRVHAPTSTESGAHHFNERAPFDREAITAKNVQSLVDSLTFANSRLEGTMYRIGYLEAQVASLEEQLKVLPEFRNRAAKAILVERENDMLKDEVDSLHRTISTREGNIAAMHTHQATLEASLDSYNEQLDRVQQQWWFRLFSRLFGFRLK